MKKFLASFLLASVSLIFLIFFVFFRFNDDKLHLVFCDVGQGDALYIRAPNEADILIDGGPGKKVLDCLSENMPFWDRSLDIVILTHPDADHITGIIDVIERYNVNLLLTQSRPSETQIYKRFIAVLAEKKLSAKYLKEGDRLKIGDGVELEILSPASDQVPRPYQNSANIRLNENSVVALLTYANFSALLTGDASSKVMDQIAQGAPDVDILKIPHHGSKTGMSDYLLSLTRPKLAVISVGLKNPYGHPAKLTLDLLKKHDIKVLRTDLDGELEVISDGTTYYVDIKNQK